MATPFVKIVFEGTSTARLIRLCDTRDFEAVRCVAHSKSLYVAGSGRSVSSATQLHDAFVQHKGSAPLVLRCSPGRPSGSQPVSLPDYPAGKFYGHDATPSIIAHVFASPNPVEAEQRNQEHPPEGLNTVDPLHVLANGKAATLPDVLRLFEVLHPTSSSAVSYIIRSLPRDTAAAFITVILPAIATLACAPVPQVPGASELVLSSTVIARRLARGFLGVNGATSGLHLLLTKTRACQDRWPRVDELRQRVHLLIGYFRTQQTARPRNVLLRRLQRSSDVSASALESCSTIRPPELDARVAFGDDVAQVWPVSAKLASGVFRSDSSERCNRVLEFPELLVTLDEGITGRDLDPQHEIMVFSDVGRFFSFHSVHRQFVPVQPVTVLEKVVCAVFDDYQSLSISQGKATCSTSMSSSFHSVTACQFTKRLT